jgi:hypothetical protein
MTNVTNKYYRILNDAGIDDMLEQGKAWYPQAWNHCLDVAKVYPVTAQRVAAVMAVTSPRARWAANVAATYAIVEDSFKPNYQRRSGYGILGANSRKGLEVMTGRYYSRLVTGPKVSTFYANILGHTDMVTVDSLMSKAAGYGSDVSPKIRAEVTDACENLATVFDTTPRDMQAAVWIAFRGAAY